MPGQVAYQTFRGVAVFALVLGILNAFVAPVIKLLTVFTFHLRKFGDRHGGIFFFETRWRPQWDDQRLQLLVLGKRPHLSNHTIRPALLSELVLDKDEQPDKGIAPFFSDL